MDDKGPDLNNGGDENRSRDENLRQRLETFVPDLIRRTFYAGIGAIFTSEEGIRRIANDFSLPKDAANYLVSQAQSTKNDLFRIFATEIRRFLEGLRINEELQRLLASMAVEVKAEVRFVPQDGETVSRTKSEVRIRKTASGEHDSATEQEDS